MGSGDETVSSRDETFYRWIDYRGFEILELDLRGCSGEESVRRQVEASRVVSDRPLRSVRSLSIAWGIRYDPRYIRQITDQMRKNNRFMIASAIVGLEHLTRLVNILNRLSGRRVRAFDDRESALDWLIREEPGEKPGTHE